MDLSNHTQSSAAQSKGPKNNAKIMKLWPEVICRVVPVPLRTWTSLAKISITFLFYPYTYSISLSLPSKCFRTNFRALFRAEKLTSRAIVMYMYHAKTHYVSWSGTIHLIVPCVTLYPHYTKPTPLSPIQCWITTRLRAVSPFLQI